MLSSGVTHMLIFISNYSIRCWKPTFPTLLPPLEMLTFKSFIELKCLHRADMIDRSHLCHSHSSYSSRDICCSSLFTACHSGVVKQIWHIRSDHTFPLQIMSEQQTTVVTGPHILFASHVVRSLVWLNVFSLRTRVRFHKYNMWYLISLIDTTFFSNMKTFVKIQRGAYKKSIQFKSSQVIWFAIISHSSPVTRLCRSGTGNVLSSRKL